MDRRVFWLGALLFATGCTLPPIVLVDAASSDDGLDASGPDALVEAGADAARESGPEAAAEAAVEAGPDAPPDVHGMGPVNDDFGAPVDFPSTPGESTVTGNTAGATADRVPGGLAAGAFTQGNIWFRFTLVRATLVYLDTHGSAVDAGLFLLKADGGPAMPTAPDATLSTRVAMANDNCECVPVGGVFPTLQRTDAVTAGVLPPATYLVSVSAPPGDVTVNLQRLPLTTTRGAINLQIQPLNVVPLPVVPMQGARVGNTGTVNALDIPGASAAPGCTFTAPNPEQALWFFSCGGWGLPSLSLCPAHNGSYGVHTPAYDPVLYVIDGFTGPELPAVCNDDQNGAEGACTMAGQGYAPTISTLGGTRRGLQMVVVDERGALSTSNMPFTLGYSVQ